jgi:hypothetical protein
MKSILFIVLVLFGFIGVFAQERTISKAEFNVVFSNPNQLALIRWKGKSFRNIRTIETKVEGPKPLDQFLKSTHEFVPNYAPESNRLYVSRFITENRIGSKTTKSESIQIGEKSYKRQDNEPWTEEAVEVKPKPTTTDTTASPAFVSTEVERTAEYKYLGSEKINNQTANLYAVIIKTTHFNPTINEETRNTQTSKYWFNEDGVMLKEDIIWESRSKAVTFYNHRTSVWELDPNIKIEAPVVN